MNLFYISEISTNILLNEEEVKHCVKVLRLHKGDTIHITDGKGFLYEAILDITSNKECIAQIIHQKHYPKNNFYLHLAVSPTKNINRFEWFLEKATEIGIDEITPLVCQHSERKNINSERLKKIMISALKQSQRVYLPKLNNLISFAELIKNDFKDQRFIAHLDEANNKPLKSIYSKGKNALILVGPEGDFSADEILQAKEKGFIPVNLGPARLRTETAGIAACQIINFMNE